MASGLTKPIPPSPRGQWFWKTGWRDFEKRIAIAQLTLFNPIPMLEGMRWRKMLSRDDVRKAEAYLYIRRSLTNGTRGQQIASDRPGQLRISGLIPPPLNW